MAVILDVIYNHHGPEGNYPWATGRWAKLVDPAAAAWGGPGSLAPAILQAEPDFSLTLPAHSLILLARTPEES
jgi:hypothetical protein